MLFYNSFGGSFWFSVSIEGSLKAPLFNSSSSLLWQQVKAKNVGCFIQYFYPIFFNMLAVNKRFVYNKKIKSPAGAGWDAYTWAASHYSPHVCAPYLKVIHHPLFSKNQAEVQLFFTTAFGVRFSFRSASKEA